MMRSLSSAVAGLRTHQTKMDVIGNNIANVNTYGFKSSRASFSDVYYQNIAGASSARSTVGGTNPTQIGYGSTVATIDMMITQSSAASTDRALDVFISGDGFLISQDASGKKQYLRLGTLYFDAAGNLVDGNGQYILGFPMITDPDTGEVRPDVPSNGKSESSALVPIKITPPGSMSIEEFFDTLTGISISPSGEIIGLQEGDTQIILTSAVPAWANKDSFQISPTSTYAGSVRVAISGLPDAGDASTALGITIDKVDFGTMALEAGNYTLDVDPTTQTVKLSLGSPPVELTGTLKDGKIILKNSAGDVGMTLHTSATALTAVTGGTLALELHQQMTTTDLGGNTVKVPATGPVKYTAPTGATPYPYTLSFGDISFTLNSDPGAPGALPLNAIIGTAGPGEGKRINIGNLALAKFRNNEGLRQAGSSYFEATVNSGDPVCVRPGLEGTGNTTAGYLEQSNVDIAKEFTDMITTQRGFQANTRIITVSDEMLQELVNLKR